jgi:hypothetical protein
VLGHVAALSQWTVSQTIHRGSGLIHSTSSGDDGVTGAAAADLFLQARGSDAVPNWALYGPLPAHQQ